MAFDSATARAQLETMGAATMLSAMGSLTDRIQGKVIVPTDVLDEKFNALRQYLTSLANPIHKLSTTLASVGAGQQITRMTEMAARRRSPEFRMPGGILPKIGRSLPHATHARKTRGFRFTPADGHARRSLLAGKSAIEQPFPFSSLAGLAEKMQLEAARQDFDRQRLQAQEEANQHLSNLAGAAGGAGLRVQVVGAQSGHW
jgi:hypothetical protein